MTLKWSALALAAVVLIAASLPVRAASLYTETFSGSTGGWQQSTNIFLVFTNSASGGNPGGCLQGTFAIQQFPGVPIPVAFMATGALASAGFVGDYKDVDAFLLGFDFRANDVVPGVNGLKSIIRSESLFIYRLLDASVTATGQWYRFRFPLLPTRLDGWLGDTALFTSIMSNVTRLEVELLRNGSPQQTYLLDNVFLDRLPEAAALSMVTSGVDVTWLHMRTGEIYRFEAASDLVQADWVLVSNITAAGGAQVLSHGGTNTFQGYRVVIP